MDSLPQTPQEEVVVVLRMCSEELNEAPLDSCISIESGKATIPSTSDTLSMTPSDNSKPSARFTSCPGVRIVIPREWDSESGVSIDIDSAASTETESGSRVDLPLTILETGLCSVPSMSHVISSTYWVMANRSVNLQPFKYPCMKGSI